MGEVNCSKKLRTSEVNIVDADFENIVVPNGYTLNYVLEQLEALIPTTFKSVIEFGAKGDGTTNDRVAFQAAIDYCIQNDEALYVPAGVYIINTQEGTTGTNTQSPLQLDNLTADGQSLYMFGDGKGKTIIKEKDGCLDFGWNTGIPSNANYNRLFYCYMTSTPYSAGHYVFKGITFDKNNRSNSTTPYTATGGLFGFENATILQFSGNTGSSGMPSIKSVTVDDCEFIDKMGPCVNLSTSDVNVTSIVINNCYSVDHPTVMDNPTEWGEREDFGLAIDCENTIIQNTTCLYSQIEPTVESTSTRVRRYKMNNCKIGKLEFTEGGTGGDYTFVDLVNMHIDRELVLRGMHVTIANSTIKVPLNTSGTSSSFLSPLTMRAVNCTILLHNVAGDVKPLYIKHGNVAGGETDFSYLASADFVNCDIVIDSTETVSTGYALSSGLSRSDQSAPCPVTFTGCRFDERLYGVLSSYNTGGDFTFNNCILAGSTYVFSAGTQRDKVCKLTINNCDFSKVTGTNILINRPTLSIGSFELSISGTYSVSDWSYATSGSANIDAYYKIKPKLIGSTYPTSGYWFKGDTVYNDFTSTTDVAGWVCTTEGTSGTWTSFGATNLTKSYVDSGLSAKENSSNKENTTLDTSSTKYPTNNLVKSYVDSGLSGKQATLASGTNIKTLNGNSILGSGDLTTNSALIGNAALFTFSFVDTANTFYTAPSPSGGVIDLTTITKFIFENNLTPTGVKTWVSQIASGSLIQLGVTPSQYAIYTVTGTSTGVVGEDSIPVRNIDVTYLLGSGSITDSSSYPISFIKSTSGSSLGYTAEDVANKENTTLDTSTTKYPTNNLVKSYVDSSLGELTRSWTTINNSTTVIASNMNSGTLQGTATAVTSAATNTKTKQIRVNVGVTTPAVDGQCGYRQTVNLVSLGSGFRMFVGFGVDDSAYNAGAIQFYGLTTAIALLTASSTVTLASLTNLIGIGSDAADTNLQMFYNDGSGTCTKIDLGSNFPANRTSGATLDNWYTLELFSDVGSTSINYRVINRTSGNVASGVISSNLPTALLFAQLYRTSGSSSGACSFSYSKMILRTIA